MRKRTRLLLLGTAILGTAGLVSLLALVSPALALAPFVAALAG